MNIKLILKNLVAATDNETLLKHWKEQLEWDIQHRGEIELSDEEWQAVKEGLADYENGAIMSLKEFIEKR